MSSFRRFHKASAKVRYRRVSKKARVYGPTHANEAVKAERRALHMFLRDIVRTANGRKNPS